MGKVILAKLAQARAQAFVDLDQFRNSQRIFVGLIFVVGIYALAVSWVGRFELLSISGLAVMVSILFFWARPLFVLAFLPFALVLWMYSGLSSIVHAFSPMQVHIVDLLEWERQLFGNVIPAVKLQGWINSYQFWREVATFVANFWYMSFFIVPVLASAVLWEKNRSVYWPFIYGYLGLSLLGLVSYFFFPAAPPWYAAHFGYFPEYMPKPDLSLLPSTDLLLSLPNPVGAMPSMHAAYPMYVAIFLIRIWGRSMLITLCMPLFISLSAVYLGHHYIVDIVVGILFGLVAGLLTVKSISIIKSRFTVYDTM